MARYKSRREAASESFALKCVKHRRALGEIRELMGLEKKATHEDVVEAVRALVGKEKKEEENGEQEI